MAGRERRPLRRRGGALVAWRSPADATPTAGFRIVGAHTDSPNLRIKPHPDTGSVGLAAAGVEVYGGALVNSWLDRDLGLSGRLVPARRRGRADPARTSRWPASRSSPSTSTGTSTSAGSLLDKQEHLTPVWGLGPPTEGAFVELVAAAAGLDRPTSRPGT